MIFAVIPVVVAASPVDIAPVVAHIAALVAVDTGVADHLPDKRQVVIVLVVDSPGYMAGRLVVAHWWIDKVAGSRAVGD